ncbi:rhamnosyltransferase [Methylobacterium platani JCM 14648]|uniref:Rhamnosyltransferase n=2 Tax=Methylobacterium platani TaxID=427683 RepID=A0A179S348_9HYPH|nr:glycosyltransferase family 2 protein [Methylobacterium platani]KMO14294.1 rhamnosyltransferase [Methylobacterium platani JCM 14648]OAS20210.1 rhamnosyltransferase [Methylobacterium platani]
MPASSARPSPVAVGITVFRPTPGQVASLRARVEAEPRLTIVFDNGGLPAEDAAHLAARGALVLSAGRNIGIGGALDAIARAASGAGAAQVLLLDQDAAFTPAQVSELEAALARLTTLSLPPALVGPRPEAAPGAKAPAYPRRPEIPDYGSLVPVEFLATSGSLLDLAAYARIGPFRSDFFIDGVDLEWGFRAWARGYGCWMETRTALPHRVGAGTIRSRLLGIAMPRQPLFRMTAYLRNSVYAWRLPHVPGRWRRRQAAYLPLQALLYWADSGYRPRVLALLAGAVLDGLRGRLGRPKGLPSE